jgi:isopenicillin N synthase-like dioxygenase
VSNQHRVVNRSGGARYSIPMFYNLEWDTEVSCLPTCTSEDNPPKHPPIKSGDYLLSRFRTVQKYKAEAPA